MEVITSWHNDDDVRKLFTYVSSLSCSKSDRDVFTLVPLMLTVNIYPVGKIAKKKNSLKECVFVDSALKIQCLCNTKRFTTIYRFSITCSYRFDDIIELLNGTTWYISYWCYNYFQNNQMWIVCWKMKYIVTLGIHRCLWKMAFLFSPVFNNMCFPSV